MTELWGDGMNQGRHPGLDPGSVEDGILAYTDAVVRQAHQPAQGDGFLLVEPLWFDKLTNRLRVTGFCL